MADEEEKEEDFACKKEFISLLPPNYAYFISSIEQAKDSENDYTVTFRIKGVATEESARDWFGGFQESSKMTFRLDRSYPDSGRKNLWKADFRCHHNTRNKKTVGKGKNSECKGTLTIIVKRVLEKTRSNDPYLKEWPTIVIIKMFHNHPLDSAPALKYRSVSKDTDDKLIQLFRDGHTPISALKAHKVDLMLEHGDNYPSVSADRRICPDQSYCYRLYYKRIGGPIKSSEKSLEGGVNISNVPIPKADEVPKKKKSKKKRKQKKETVGKILLLSVPPTEDADRNIALPRNDGTPIIIQTMPVAHMDELQAAVQALESGVPYNNLQTLSLAFSQTGYQFQPVKDAMCSAKEGWDPNDSNDVQNIPTSMECGQESGSTSVLNVKQASQTATENTQDHFTVSEITPYSETLTLIHSDESIAMDVTLSSGDVLNNDAETVPQILNTLKQTLITDSSQQNVWQAISQSQPPPHFSQATISVPAQLYQEEQQPQFYQSQIQTVQTVPFQVHAQMSRQFGPMGKEQPSTLPANRQPIQAFPVSPHNQNLVQQQLSVPQPNLVTCHQVVVSNLTESPQVDSLPKQQQTDNHQSIAHDNFMDTNEHAEANYQSSATIHSAEDILPRVSTLVGDKVLSRTPAYSTLPNRDQVLIENAVASDVRSSTLSLSETGTNNEQDLDTWVDTFLTTMRDKFLFNDLYRTAFARLRKNVEQNAKTDLALCSALSNFAKRPHKVAKPNMDIVYSGSKHDRTSGSHNRYFFPGTNRFHFRSRPHLSVTRRHGRAGKYPVERDKFGRWRRSLKRKQQSVQLDANEAPGLREILDTFDTVESEQQREREKEGAEALLQMEACVVMKNEVHTSEEVIILSDNEEVNSEKVEKNCTVLVEKCHSDVGDQCTENRADVVCGLSARESGDPCILNTLSPNTSLSKVNSVTAPNKNPVNPMQEHTVSETLNNQSKTVVLNSLQVSPDSHAEGSTSFKTTETEATCTSLENSTPISSGILEAAVSEITNSGFSDTH